MRDVLDEGVGMSWYVVVATVGRGRALWVELGGRSSGRYYTQTWLEQYFTSIACYGGYWTVYFVFCLFYGYGLLC